ncbi:MAG: hypothetical protein M1823_004962 [Watsoniomyces obsoletus]|nr:MAG: hypothetical protein M1823_004962 [Watsoniomyces obsoletus]
MFQDHVTIPERPTNSDRPHIDDPHTSVPPSTRRRPNVSTLPKTLEDSPILTATTNGPLTDDPIGVTEDKYPKLDECRKNVKVDANKSLFYFKVGKHKDKPQKYADKRGLTMVREAYPDGFTDKNDTYTGYKKFAQRFSQAFAEATSGTAYAMLPTDGTDISKSVWTETEKPKLVASGGKCNRIIKVDPNDFDKTCILWDRSDKGEDDVLNCDKENGKVPDKKTSGAGKGSPPTTPKGVASVDPPAAPVCAPSPSGKVKDSHENELKLAAAYFCKQHASETGAKGPIDINHAIMAGDQNMGRTTVKMAFPYPPSMGNQDDVYDISLKSVPNCAPRGGSFNLATPVANNQCSDILFNAWRKCNNKGRGGSITAGCLVYSIKTRF